jgi:hypothetical protein
MKMVGMLILVTLRVILMLTVAYQLLMRLKIRYSIWWFQVKGSRLYEFFGGLIGASAAEGITNTWLAVQNELEENTEPTEKASTPLSAECIVRPLASYISFS